MSDKKALKVKALPASWRKKPKLPSGDSAFNAAAKNERLIEMNFAGALSFMRRVYSKNTKDVDVVVTGIPFDLATSHRPGARFGPLAIREASSFYAELPSFLSKTDPLNSLRIIDYGDCFINLHDQKSVAPTIYHHAKEIIKNKAKCLSLGGDHFITYPLLRAHAEKYGPLALLQFDSHSDTWPISGDDINHGTMFTKAIKEGLIDPKKSVQVGIRSHNDDDYGITVLDMDWIENHGIVACSQRILEVIGKHPTYLTFDIDCLDPSCAPGTGTPVPGGLLSREVFSILRKIDSLKIIAADIVEVSPTYDHADITAMAAAGIALQILCIWADEKN